MPPRAPHPHAERLAHPDVLAKIRSVIPRRLQQADRDDVAQGALLRLFMLDTLPADHDGLLAMAVVMARRVALDRLRLLARATKRETDEHDVDELARQELPSEVAEQILQLVDQRVADGKYPPIVRKVVRLIHEDYTYEEIAEIVDVSASSLRKMMSRVRKDILAQWPTYACMVGVITVALFVAFHRPSPADDRSTIGYEPEAPAPSASAEPNPEDTQMPPATWREFAHEACNGNEIDRCERYLDKAKKLDPDGELDPDVQYMRGTIARYRGQMRLESPDAGDGTPRW